MKQIIGGSIILLAGVALIAFRRAIVDYVVKTNNEGGLGLYRYGKSEKAFGLRTIPLFGVLLMILGALILLGLFDLK